MMKMNHWIVTGAIVIAWLAVSSAWAVEGTWNGSASNSWANNGNWDGSHPSSGGNTWDAIFQTVGAGNLSNALGANHTVRSLTFNDNVDSTVQIYLRSGVGSSGNARSLTFNSNIGDATLTVASGATGGIQFRGLGNLILQDDLIIDHDGSGQMLFNRPFTGAYGITKQGAGTVFLNLGNMNQASAININDGRLSTSAAQKLNDAAPVTMTGGTLALGGNETIGSLGGSGGTVALGANRLTTGSLNSDTDFEGVISGTGSMTKTGSGTLTLSGANTYSGGTTVSAGGRLSVNGSLGNTAVTVQSGGELGGSGTIAGTVAVANGGRLSPGNSIDVLTQGATSFASGATFAYEVNSTDLDDLANAADLLVVNGNLDIAAGTLLEFNDLAAQAQAFVEDSTVFAMINYTGAWNNGLFTYNGQPLADGSRFSVGSQLWEIDYDFVGTPTEPLNFRDSYVPASGTQTFVTVTAVPEPATLVLLAAAAGLAAFTRRRW